MITIKREVPFRATPETMRESKRINAYISTDPLRLEIKLFPKIFNVFLNAIPANKRDKYQREGIPYGQDGIYTLVLK